MKRNLEEVDQFGLRGGSWFLDNPEFFAAWFRGYSVPDHFNDVVGFVAAVPAQDSK